MNKNGTTEQEPRAEVEASAHDAIVMLRNFDDAWEFVDKRRVYETTTRPDVDLKPVPYMKCVLHDYLESEELTLLKGSDGNYYCSRDREGPYGDYARTEWTEYFRFDIPDEVEAHLPT